MTERYQEALRSFCVKHKLPVPLFSNIKESSLFKSIVVIGEDTFESSKHRYATDAESEVAKAALQTLQLRQKPQSYSSIKSTNHVVYRPQKIDMNDKIKNYVMSVINEAIADVDTDFVLISEVDEWFSEYDHNGKNFSYYTKMNMLDLMIRHPHIYEVSFAGKEKLPMVKLKKITNTQQVRVQETTNQKTLSRQHTDTVPFQQYKPYRRVVRRTYGRNDAKTSGSRPITEMFEFVNKLHLYFIPHDMDTLVYASDNVNIDTIANKLREQMKQQVGYLGEPQNAVDNAHTWKSYRHIFKYLLWLEELQMKIDIRQYDLTGTRFYHEERFGWTKIYVPTLAEKRPSILRGDSIYVNATHDQGCVHHGYVHFVRLDHIIVSFAHNAIEYELLHDAQFTFSRTPLRIMHRALEAQLQIERLFLDVHYREQKWKQELKSLTNDTCKFDKYSKMNSLQRQAINLIVCRKPKIPVVILGPPGTGKTLTLVECIHQVLLSNPDARILACTPSNESADIICARLHAVCDLINAKNMIRLNAFQRNPNTIIDDIVLEYSYQSKINKSFYIPDKGVICHAKVVISTLITSSYLYSMGLSNHFTHIFIDECGQAMEPESLIPLLVANENAVVSFIGDPKQLGPIIRSPVALNYQLDRSLIEKFITWNEKSQQGVSCCHTIMLQDSYRSHPAIMLLYSTLFYDKKLHAVGDHNITHSMVYWPGFALSVYGSHGRVPILFKHTLGLEKRTKDSPSWFNETESEIVLKTVKDLLQFGVKCEDIGIITPYRKQVEHIKSKLQRSDIQVGTTEVFQGKEKNVIIISTVRSQSQYLNMDHKFKLGFLKNPKRLNVAISRARAALIMIGNANILSLDPHWRKLIEICIEMKAYEGALPIIERSNIEEVQEDEDDFNVDAPWRLESTF
jgi:helicase MOV-10